MLHFVSYGSGLLVRTEYNVLGINLTKQNAGWKNSRFKRFPIFLGGREGFPGVAHIASTMSQYRL